MSGRDNHAHSRAMPHQKDMTLTGVSLIGYLLISIFAVPTGFAQTAQTYAPSEPSPVTTTTVTRTVTTRTYTRRINADGSVTEIPSSTSASAPDSVSTSARRFASVSESRPTSSTFDRTASAPVVSQPRQYSPTGTPTQTSYSSVAGATSYTEVAPVRTVTRTYTRQSSATPSTNLATVQQATQSPPASNSVVGAASSATAAPRVSVTTPVASEPAPVQIASVPPPSRKPETVPKAPAVTTVQPQRVSTDPADATANARSAILKSAPKLPADEVPSVETLHQILWSTFYVMETARNSGNYDDFLKILSPRMKGEYSPTELPKAFDSMTEEQQQIQKAVGAPALFELQPYLMTDGRMRLRGAFPTEVNEALRFDMLYTNVDGVWYVDAMALAKG